MSDPRFVQREKKLPPMRQDGYATNDYKDPDTETKRRLKELLEAQAPPQIPAPSPQQNIPGTGNPNLPVAPDRWHKEGSLRVTVSNEHLIGQDPVLQSDWTNVVMLGYAEAKSLYTQYVAAFPSQSQARVTLEIHGGIYFEDCTFDSPHVDVIGIGRPQIIGKCVVTAAATEILIEDIHFYYDNTLASHPYQTTALTINMGVEIGDSISTVQVRNCIIHAPYTALYCQRWTLFENCHIYSDLIGAVGITAAYIRYCNNDGASGMQNKWTKFVGCFISGAAGIVDDATGTHVRGGAFSIFAVDDTGTLPPGFSLPPIWIDNALAFDLPGAGSYVYFRTGVILIDCEIDGWAENYGWALEYSGCKIIGGQWVVATIDQHLLQFGRTQNGGGFGVGAFSWFTGGTEADVTYLVVANDVNNVDNSAIGNNVWLRNMSHAGTRLRAPGGNVVQPGTGINTANLIHVYATNVDTDRQYFYMNPVATEGANLVDCNSDIVNVGIHHTFVNSFNLNGQQGYHND